MKRSIRLLVTAAVVSLLAACASSGITPELPPATGDYGVTTDDYRIDVGDEVSVNVWKNGELNITEPVRPDGKIAVHLVGDIAAAGKTPEQLATDIEAALSNYIKDPNVTVILTALAGQDFRSKIRVTGAVNKIASISYAQGMTVIDAVLGAGGLSIYANGNQAKLHRTTADGIKTYNIRLKDILENGNMATNVRLMPGDVITVPESVF